MSQGESLRQGSDGFPEPTAAGPGGQHPQYAENAADRPDGSAEQTTARAEAEGDGVVSESGEPAGGSPDEKDQGETVQDPAKLVRLSRMIGELLGEVREGELDEGTLVRLRTHVEHTAKELGDVLSPDLHDELTRLRTLWTEASGVSQAELRIEQAQLAGWLEGVLQGIQSALSAEQAAAQQQAAQQPGEQPGSPFSG